MDRLGRLLLCAPGSQRCPQPIRTAAQVSVLAKPASDPFDRITPLQRGQPVRPIPSLTLGLVTQNEWTHEQGFGEVENTFGLLAVPILTPPVLEDANFDEFKSMQNAELRFTKIPRTVLFADARFEHDGSTTFQQGNIDGSSNPFERKSDAENQQYDVRSGFTTSPRTWLSFNTQYRFYASDTSYHHLIDSTPLTGYPAFILGRAHQNRRSGSEARAATVRLASHHVEL